MKLLFDARYIRTDYHDGISRYTHELGNALAGLTELAFIISDDEQRRFLPDGATTIKIHPVTSWLEPLTALFINRHQPDVVVSPLQTMGSFGKRYKLILTLHDTFYYDFPTPPPQFAWHIRLGWRLYHLTKWPGKLILDGANTVATVSETSRQAIQNMGLTKRPIIVVANAARDLSVHLKRPVAQNIRPPKNLIYMGAFLPYKNVELLIRMMEFLPGRRLHLLSRISTERQQELTKLIPAGADVIFHKGVSDQEYAELLADNAIAVSASRAEGFGLPLAEAMQLGVPSVVSDIMPFREVGGAGVLLASPNSPEDFANKIISLDDQVVRQKQVAKARHHIQKFSWQQSALTLLEACLKLKQS